MCLIVYTCCHPRNFQVVFVVDFRGLYRWKCVSIDLFPSLPHFPLFPTSHQRPSSDSTPGSDSCFYFESDPSFLHGLSTRAPQCHLHHYHQPSPRSPHSSNSLSSLPFPPYCSSPHHPYNLSTPSTLPPPNSPPPSTPPSNYPKFSS